MIKFKFFFGQLIFLSIETLLKMKISQIISNFIKKINDQLKRYFTGNYPIR